MSGIRASPEQPHTHTPTSLSSATSRIRDNTHTTLLPQIRSRCRTDQGWENSRSAQARLINKQQPKKLSVGSPGGAFMRERRFGNDDVEEAVVCTEWSLW